MLAQSFNYHPFRLPRSARTVTSLARLHVGAWGGRQNDRKPDRDHPYPALGLSSLTLPAARGECNAGRGPPGSVMVGAEPWQGVDSIGEHGIGS